MSSRIHHEVGLPGSPKQVFEALLSAERFTEVTGLSATIDARPGGRFSCFDGMIEGMNVELLPGLRIVQAWRVADWPDGQYSIARFELEPFAQGTRLVFDHMGFPPDQQSHLDSGWRERYWAPLDAYLRKQQVHQRSDRGT